MDFGRPNAEIGRKMANGRLLFLALHTYINNRLNTTYFLHLLPTYSSYQSEVLPVTIKYEQ